MTDLPPDLQPPVPRGPRSSDLDPAVVDVMLAEIMGMTVDRKPTWRERLAERPTAERAGLVLLMTLMISAMWLGGMGWRQDLVGAALLHYAGLSLVLVGAFGFAGLAALRMVTRRLPDDMAIALTLATPVLLAAIPGAWPGMRPPEGIPFDAHVMCGMMGLMLGLMYAAPLLLVQRDRPDRGRLALVGASAGALAFVVQNLVCGAGETTHLVFAHGFGSAAIATLLLGGFAVARWRR